MRSFPDKIILRRATRPRAHYPVWTSDSRDAFKYGCPECGAERNNYCVAEDGKVADNICLERLKLAGVR